MWHVYIVQCSDGSLYTGSTTDIEARLKRHNAGKASKYTRSRRPVALVYTEEFDDRPTALSREIEIKNFGVENKKRLIRFGLGQRSPSALDTI